MYCNAKWREVVRLNVSTLKVIQETLYHHMEAKSKDLTYWLS